MRAPPMSRIIGLVLFILSFGTLAFVAIFALLWASSDVGRAMITVGLILAGPLVIFQFIHSAVVASHIQSTPEQQKRQLIRVALLGPVGVLLNVWEMTSVDQQTE